MNNRPLAFRAAQFIETQGNRLPAPVVLFIGLWLLVVVLSAMLEWIGVSGSHPLTGEAVGVRSLLAPAGITWMLDSAVPNFTGFAPVGPVLAVMLGIGVAERSGLLGLWLQQALRHLPRWGLTAGVALLGMMSSLAFDAGYIVVIPLAALLFQWAGRSPLAGIAVAFAAVSGGFSANLLVGPVDTILAGISTESAALVDPAVRVGVLANYYFLAASVLLLIPLISVVLQRWVEPWLEQGRAVTSEPDDLLAGPAERRAAALSAGLLLLLVAGLLWLALPAGAPLASADGFLHSPLMRNISVVIGVLLGVCGWVYGVLAGRYHNSRVLVHDMEDTFRVLAPYLVLMFFAAQFVAAFGWSRAGLWLAVEGAGWLQALQLPALLMLWLAVCLTAMLNLLIGSASAKWALLAPVMVPMLMLVGIPPEATQAAYRIGDSATNIVTPLMPYFPLVLALVQKYQPDAGVGTLMAMMMPFAVLMLAGWSLLLLIWVGMGWPLGAAL